MFSDLKAVIWKECREIFFASGSGLRLRLLFFVAAVGIYVPFRQGAEWVSAFTTPIIITVEVVFLLLNMIADVIAGERERHTLETLLASRLADSAILFGKIITTILYGWLVALVLMVVGLLTVNITDNKGTLLFYDWPILVSGLLVSLPVMAFITLLGAIISLKAATVRQAQQLLSLSFVLIIFASVFVLQTLPAEWTKNLDPAGWIAGITLSVLIIDAVLMTILRTLFQRQRLILS